MINCLLQVTHGENTKALGDVAWEGNLDGGLVATISCLEEWTLDELDGGNFEVYLLFRAVTNKRFVFQTRRGCGDHRHF